MLDMEVDQYPPSAGKFFVSNSDALYRNESGCVCSSKDASILDNLYPARIGIQCLSRTAAE
jgi:hypothetical protein